VLTNHWQYVPVYVNGELTLRWGPKTRRGASHPSGRRRRKKLAPPATGSPRLFNRFMRWIEQMTAAQQKGA
jgi:hypothetical protein